MGQLVRHAQVCWLLESSALSPAPPALCSQASGAAGSDGADQQALQKLAEALVNSRDTGHSPYLVSVRIRFADSQECSFGLLLHRRPHEVKALHFADKRVPVLQGQADFLYQGHLPGFLQQKHLQAIADHTAKWGFGVAQNSQAGACELQEAFYLIRLEQGELSLDKMAEPAPEERQSITVREDAADCPGTVLWLGPEVDKKEVSTESDDEEEQYTFIMEHTRKNLSPFCCSLGWQCTKEPLPILLQPWLAMHTCLHCWNAARNGVPQQQTDQATLVCKT